MACSNSPTAPPYSSTKWPEIVGQVDRNDPILVGLEADKIQCNSIMYGSGYNVTLNNFVLVSQASTCLNITKSTAMHHIDPHHLESPIGVETLPTGVGITNKVFHYPIKR